MTVILRTHGGLGNQLFQILFARLFASTKQQTYREIHDARYTHNFTRSVEIEHGGSPALRRQRLISRLRIPKILSRTRLCSTEIIALLGDAYLDGYFQAVSDYAAFPDALIAQEIARLRLELGITPRTSASETKLYHIRLGDFFNERENAVDHAISRVAQLDAGSTIITNQEDIFREARVAGHLDSKGCKLHPTGDFLPEDVIRFMGQFGTIYTNNSTLALWASILGNCRTTFDDERLSALHRRLFEAANQAP